MEEKLFTRPFVQLLVVQASFSYAFSTFSLLPTWLDAVLGLDSAQIGVVMGMFGVTSIVFVPVVGFAVDRRARRPFMLVGMIVSGLCALGFLVVDHAGVLLYALRLAQGIAFATFVVAGMTIATDLAPPARISQALGVFGVTNLVMNAVAPAATEWIAGAFGWPPAFAISAACAGVGTLLILGVDVPSSEGRSAEVHPSVRVSPIALALRPAVLRPSIAIGLTAVTCSAVFVFYQPYALASGLENVSGFFVAYAIGAAIARIGFGDLADRRGRLRVARASALPYALAPLVLIGVDPVRLLACGLVLGLSHGFLYPALHAMVVAAVPSRERGGVTGIFLGAWIVGFAAGPPALGWVSERVGFPLMFVSSAGFSLVALASLVAWRSGSIAPPPATITREPAGASEPIR